MSSPSVDEVVIASISRVLGIDNACIHPWDTLEALGFDSLQCMLLSVDLEYALGITASMSGNDVVVLTTVQSLIDVVTNRLQGHTE